MVHNEAKVIIIVTHCTVLLSCTLMDTVMQLLDSCTAWATSRNNWHILRVVLWACIVINVQQYIKGLSLLKHLFIRPIKHLVIHPGMVIEMHITWPPRSLFCTSPFSLPLLHCTLMPLNLLNTLLNNHVLQDKLSEPFVSLASHRVFVS